MLYRSPEAQAAELGLGTRSERRPRIASACMSQGECKRWRGEILYEISRNQRYKTVCLSCVVLSISCIQIFLCTAGLMMDYEVQDFNNEVNKFM